jgi:hypothetical protein
MQTWRIQITKNPLARFAGYWLIHMPAAACDISAANSSRKDVKLTLQFALAKTPHQAGTIGDVGHKRRGEATRR